MGDEDVKVRATPEREPSILDGLAIGARAGRFTRSSEMYQLTKEEAYNELNDEMYRLTGERLPNPMTQDRLRVGGIRNEALGPQHPDNTERAWLERFSRLTSPSRSVVQPDGKLKPTDPRVQALIVRALPDAINRRSEELAREAAAENADYNARFGVAGMLLSGFGDYGGNLFGGDIPTQATAGAGTLYSTTSRTVAGILAREALINGIGSAVSEYSTAVGAERIGEDYDFGDFATNVTVGTVAGAVIGTTVQAGVRYASGERLPLARLPSEDFSRVIAEAPAQAAPEINAALRRADSDLARERATEETANGLALDEEAYRAIDEADDMVRGMGEEPEPPARVREAEPEERAMAEQVADQTPPPESGTRSEVTFRGVTRPMSFERFRPGDVQADPNTLQYKRSSGPDGDTGTLEGVQAFDPISAGKVLVWERADGARFIGDGHQRLALAKRADAAGQPDVALDGYLFREADGWTSEDVRLLAAQKNLREGAGDPLDVAAAIREAPDLIDNTMPLNGPVLRTGRALARLGDEALGAVRNGLVTPEQGAVIARVAGDYPELHMEIVRQFMEDPPRSVKEAEFIAREMTALPTYRQQAAQMGLFGDAPLISGARERGAIMTEAMRVLSADRRAFAAAERFAEELEAAGNVLAREENVRRADAAAALLKELTVLATRAGPVSDALRRITADAIENKTSVKKAGQQFADEVVAMLNERGLLALKTGAPSPPMPPPVPRPLHETIETDVRAQEVSRAQDMDDEAMHSAMAEAAVERAMRGDDPPAFADDALGMTPEEDLAAIDRALEALEAMGEPVDPTVREAAAAFLADADDELEAMARARLAPQGRSGDAKYDAVLQKAFVNPEPDVPANRIPAMAERGIANPVVDGASVRAVKAAEDETVKTSWGAELRARAGKDMILTDEAGNRWVVRNDVFAKTYQSAGDGQFTKTPDLVTAYWIAPDDMTIRTMEGDVEAGAGDHVMVGVIGEMWPMRADRFVQRYRVIEPDDAVEDAPRTYTAATEGEVDVEAPFQPLRYKDEAKLLDDLKWVTLPELAAIAREFEVPSTGSRADITGAIMRDWRNAQPDPDPVVGIVPPGPELPAIDVTDLVKRAAKYAGRDDATARYGDALADLVDAYARMPDAMQRLTREIEDTADDRRAGVLRAVQQELRDAPRFAADEDAPGEYGRKWQDADEAATALATFQDKWDKFAAAAHMLARETNNLPVGVTEPIQAINRIIDGLQEFAQVPESIRALVPEWKAITLDAWAQDRPWFDEAWFSGDDLTPEYYAQFFDDLMDPSKSGADLMDAMSTGDGSPHGLWEDMRRLLDYLTDGEEDSPKVSKDLQARAKALIEKLPDETGTGMFDPEAVMRAAQPEFAKLRRNMDELWDEWQPTLGKGADEVESETRGLLRTTDGYLADAMTAFDGAGGEMGLRTFSRPRGVRFAEAPRGWDFVGAGEPKPPGMTAPQIVKSIEKRFGKKTAQALLEKGRLKIVERTQDLPIFRNAPKYAMDAANPEGIAARVKKGEIAVRLTDTDWEEVRSYAKSQHTSYRVPVGQKSMQVTIDNNGASYATVSMNIDRRVVSGGGTTREALQAFGTTIGVLRYHMQQRVKAGTKPIAYAFGGGDTNLHVFYSRILSTKGMLPDGYKSYMRLPDGMFYLVPDGMDPKLLGSRMRLVSDKPDDGVLRQRRERAEQAMLAARDGGAPREEVLRLADELSAVERQLSDEGLRYARDFSVQGRRGVRGMASDGVSYLVAENLQPENINGIALHEVGGHIGMREMLGENGFQQAIDAMDALVRADDPEAIRARAQVPDDTPAHLIQEEALAYAVTDYENLQVGGRLRTLIDRIAASVRAWLWRTFPALRGKIDLSIADLHALAEGGLRHVARKEGLSDAVGPRFARSFKAVGTESDYAKKALTRLLNEAEKLAQKNNGTLPRGYAGDLAVATGYEPESIRVMMTYARRGDYGPEVAGKANAIGTALDGRPNVRAMQILDVIERIRKAGGKATQAEIAERLGTTRGSVSAILSFIRNPDKYGEGYRAANQRYRALYNDSGPSTPRFAMADIETGALREGSADDLLRGPNRLAEIADMLKDC